MSIPTLEFSWVGEKRRIRTAGTGEEGALTNG
jgi:hypothetical protein